MDSSSGTAHLHGGDAASYRRADSPGRPASGFVIVAPSFVPNSAGIGCLYRLCHELRGRGFSAFMVGGRFGVSRMDAPIIDSVEAAELCGRGYAAVYPETVAGNPLGAPTVLRWVLNRPGLLGGDAVYDAGELVFCYSDVFRPYVRNRVAGKLYMPTIDESIFRTDDWDVSRRTLECFYVGKSTWKDGIVDRGNAFEITREFPAKPELGKLFRSCRVLYCFDNSTILIYEALLCGCPVVVIPDGTQTKNDYASLELGIEGIAWGVEEFRGESVDVPAVRRRYGLVKRDFHSQLDHFIAASGQQTIAPGADAGVRRAETEEPADLQPGQSAASFAQPRRPISAGRQFERRFRRWRKALRGRWQERRLGRRLLAELRSTPAAAAISAGCPGPRPLTCFHVGRARWRDGVVDRAEAYEVKLHPQTTLASLLSLFRSAQMLHCFDPTAPVVEIALAAGCPVTIVAGKGQPVRLSPAPSIARAG